MECVLNSIFWDGPVYQGCGHELKNGQAGSNRWDEAVDAPFARRSSTVFLDVPRLEHVVRKRPWSLGTMSGIPQTFVMIGFVPKQSIGSEILGEFISRRIMVRCLTVGEQPTNANFYLLP